MNTRIAATLLVIAAACGSKKPVASPEPKGDNNSCPIEMGIDPQEPTADKPFEVQLAINEKPGVTYSWTLSSGTIQSGQGTTKIIVEGASKGTFTATVALGGDPGPTCPPDAKAVVEVK